MGVPKTFVAGEVLTASDVNTYLTGPSFAIKTADEIVNTSAVLQNDDHLVIAMPVNKNYLLTAWLLTAGAVGADLQIAFTFPANATVTHSITGMAAIGPTSASASTEMTYAGAAEDTSSPTVTVTAGTESTSVFSGLFISGYVTTAATAGNLQLQWAQSNSTASNSTFKKGSWLRLEPVV